jgi:glycosyltransferase involved in cell wall biosynthesis
MRVLMEAHACSPARGSEPGAAWNWAVHMARNHEVWMLCHPQYRDEYERLEHRPANPRLVWVALPRWRDPWKPERGEHLGHAAHYLMWQRAAYERARQLHARIGFDLAHKVGLSTISAPCQLWRLGVPLIWGPLGGGQLAPAAFRAYFGKAWRREALRAARLRLLSHWPALRRTIRMSSLVLATNPETARFLERAGARNLDFFLDSGAMPEWVSPRPRRREVREWTTLAWVGRHEPHKALPLALEALAQTRDLPVRLEIAGDGPCYEDWRALAARLGVAGRAVFHGRLPLGKVRDLLSGADALLFTSLRDSFGGVVLEAMCLGLPVLTLDHQGAGAFVPDEAGLKVPVTTPTETVRGMATAFHAFAAMTAETRARMSEASWRAGSAQSWPRRAERMDRLYEQCLSSREGSACRL